MKVEVISFRIDSESKKLIEEEAKISRITTNQVLNDMVRKHLKWDRFASEIGLLFISKQIFRQLLQNIDEKDLKILATSVCRSTLKDATLFQKGNISFKNLLETIDLWIEYSHLNFRRFTEDGKEKYVIQHDLSSKYSTYLFTAISALFSEYGFIVGKGDLSEHMLSFEITEKK